jgi:hypothetical protein
MNIEEKPNYYYIKTLTNKLNLLLLNYLYAKTNIDVSIDTKTYNIIIAIPTLEDFNAILEEVKKYYISSEYFVRKPFIIPPPEIPKPITPEFVSISHSLILYKNKLFYLI